MPVKKIIAVTGATGAQGGGLARVILNETRGNFVVRALTRKPDSDKARTLADQGAEVVAADLDDAASIRGAFNGAHGVFCVTNFWEHFSPEREQAQARIMAQAAKDCGVKHVIWSTLEDVRQWFPLADASMPTLMDRYKVPHFDGKGAIDHVFTDLGVPTTFLRASFYWENLIYFGMGPREDNDGVLALTLPLNDVKLPGIAAEDVGKCAYGIFKGGKRYIGRTIGVAGEHPTGKEMAAALSKALEREVRYNAISPEAYRNLGFPGAEDLGNMFQFQLQYNDMFCQARSVDISRELNPDLQSFADWLAANKDRIPLETAGATTG